MKKILILMISAVFVMNIMSCEVVNTENIVNEDTNNNEKIVIVKNEDVELEELIGVVTEVKELSIAIETPDGAPYVVHFQDDLMFYDNVSRDFEVGNIIVVGFSGLVMESYPMQIDAISIISNEEDNMISIDPRESISGYIREFPVFVLGKDDLVAEVLLDSVFAISLEENPSTGYRWEIVIDGFNFEMTGDGLANQSSGLVGAPTMHHFGFRAIIIGEQKIIFKLIAPDNSVEETIEYTITVK